MMNPDDVVLNPDDYHVLRAEEVYFTIYLTNGKSFTYNVFDIGIHDGCVAVEISLNETMYWPLTSVLYFKTKIVRKDK